MVLSIFILLVNKHHLCIYTRNILLDPIESIFVEVGVLTVIMKIILALFCILALAQAKVFTRCSLAKELIAKGISKDDIRNWVCLVENESGRNTGTKGGPNRNGSFDHGLFQINDKYWCKNGKKGGDCNVKCEALRTDDITEAVKCALKIKKRHGYEAWYGWKNHCKNKPLPVLTHCHL